jgi:hypothetical protein
MSGDRAGAIEQEMNARIIAAKVRLRFDRSVQRLFATLKTRLAGIVPDDHAVIFTVTAPIKLRTKTADALESIVQNGPPGGEFRGVVHGNEVRVRRVTGVAAHMPRVAGFVHNPDEDAGLVLALAEAGLRARD